MNLQTAPNPNLDALIAEYGDSIYRTCYLYLKDIHLAQDALQDTFLKVYRNYHTLRETEQRKTWIVSIAINVCKDYLRKSRFWVVDEDKATRESAVWDEIPLLADNTVSAAIAELKPKYREIVLLYYYQEFKISEIAKVLNIPEGTASVRLKRARDILKGNLKGWYKP